MLKTVVHRDSRHGGGWHRAGPLPALQSELGHEAHEVHAGHAGDEGIVLGHAAQQRSDVFGLRADVHAEDAGGTREGLVEAEQRDAGRLSRPVGPLESDGAAGEGAVQLLKNGPLAKPDLQVG